MVISTNKTYNEFVSFHLNFQIEEIFTGKLGYESVELKSIRYANSLRLISSIIRDVFSRQYFMLKMRNTFLHVINLSSLSSIDKQMLHQNPRLRLAGTSRAKRMQTMIFTLPGSACENRMQTTNEGIEKIGDKQQTKG